MIESAAARAIATDGSAVSSRRHHARTYDEAFAGLQETVECLLSESSDLRVLDAGCGGRMHLKLTSDSHIVGIDVSPQQLERNTILDERILGDIQTYRLPSQSFDLVVCWDVLEHLRRPALALRNLEQALRPGGLLVLAGPNALSLKGIATWLTPYWVHRVVYRGISERPFKTYRRIGALPVRLHRWAQARALHAEYYASYEAPVQRELRRRLGMTGHAWSVFRASMLRLSAGRVDLCATDFMLVLKR